MRVGGLFDSDDEGARSRKQKVWPDSRNCLALAMDHLAI